MADPLATPAVKVMEAFRLSDVIPVMVGAAGALISEGTTDKTFDSELLPNAFTAFILIEYD